MDRRLGWLAAALSAVIAALTLYRRRPVKPPADEGVWRPVHR